MRTQFLFYLILAALVPCCRAQSMQKPLDIYADNREASVPVLIHPAAAIAPSADNAALHAGCTMALVVEADGKPSHFRVLHSLGETYDRAAIQAASASIYRPGKWKDAPYPFWIEVWVPFRSGTPLPIEQIPLRRIDHPATAISEPKVDRTKDGAKARYQAFVRVSVLVDESGAPEDPVLVRPIGMGLDRYALEGVMNFKFTPAIRGGVSVPSRIEVEVSILI